MRDFDIAFGRCTVRDGELVVERTDPERLRRRDLLRRGISSSLAHQPLRSVAILGSIGLLWLVFGWLLWSVYRANPAVWPLVGGLAVVGVLLVAGALELSLRRALRKRRRLRDSLEGDGETSGTTRIQLDAVTRVRERPVSMVVPAVAGVQLLVQYQDDGEPVTVPLGFPKYMDEELDTARAVFEDAGVPVETDA